MNSVDRAVSAGVYTGAGVGLLAGSFGHYIGETYVIMSAIAGALFLVYGVWAASRTQIDEGVSVS